jgi:hypothetical protein
MYGSGKLHAASARRPTGCTSEQSYGCVQNGRVFYCQAQLDDKNAALTRQVAKIDFPTVHSDCLSGDREAEAETCRSFLRRSANALNGSAVLSGMPPHSSSISILRRPSWHSAGAPRARQRACT